eukprot:CAMPEP_0198733774 /NCGR_PEP_ID=MMETSP1475-20131203/48138_1 /TAXON_ID= ORGANISM="Unidentified sp., Strain CCMP1999" /NCGR_SAMPLE_ID=MMETSP1475 /ASSEMBLY_ACC=CAM_ASM_001111 /LENGTH=499 /DNA_ID=CAMNT_0044497123 /DNA_START=253 /DNA_END=1752 /DNA_ORIENTATION=-
MKYWFLLVPIAFMLITIFRENWVLIQRHEVSSEAAEGSSDLESAPETDSAELPGERTLATADNLGQIQSQAIGSAIPQRTVAKCFITRRHERFCVYERLCYHNGNFSVEDGLMECARLKGAGAPLDPLRDADCQRAEADFARDAYMGTPPTRVKIQDLPGTADYLAGDTIISFLPRSANNIAHYAGQVLFLLHFDLFGDVYNVSNPEARYKFLAAPEVVRLIGDEKSWHVGFARAVLDDRVSLQPVDDGAEGILMDKKFSFVNFDALMRQSDLSVCFDRAVIPSFLKGRWTIDESEVPGHAEGNPQIAAKAIRERTFASIGLDLPVKMSRKIIYLGRERRRAFDDASEAAFVNALSTKASEAGCTFERVSFSGLSFEEQVSAVKDAAVAVGLHGANLVNSMFMPVGAALLEIFPHGFTHEMYGANSGSGLQYFQHNIISGDEFPQLSRYLDRSECMRLDHECKLFYRADNRQVSLSQEDIDMIGNMLLEAVRAATSATA